MNMDCLQYRRKLLEDPYRNEDDFVTHEDNCRSCADYARKVRADEAKLRAALHVQPPPELAERIRLAASFTPQSSASRQRAWWLSAAAGILIIIAAFSSTLVLSPLDRTNVALAQSVLNHIDDEAHHLHEAGPVRTGKIKYVFRQLGAELEGDIGPVNFAAICLMRHRTGVHLVLSGKQGPITVFFMPDEMAGRTLPVTSHRFNGHVLPTAWGSIAVVGERDESLDGIAERMRDAVRWPTPPAQRPPLRS